MSSTKSRSEAPAPELKSHFGSTASANGTRSLPSWKTFPPLPQKDSLPPPQPLTPPLSPSPPAPPSPSSSSPLSAQPPPSDSQSPAPSPSKTATPSPPPPPPPPPPPSRKAPSPPPPLSPPNSRSHSSRSLSPPRSHKSHGGSGDMAIVAIAEIAVVGAIGVILLLALLCYCCTRKKKKKKQNYLGYDHFCRSDHFTVYGKVPIPPKQSNTEPQSGHIVNDQENTSLPPRSSGIASRRNSFNYEDLENATNGFSTANLLGQGGFGCVYKGVLANGQLIAVKQLKSGSRQGEREFQAEVEIISRVHHRDLVSLIGYCITGSQRILVYEYVSNNTLAYHLHTDGLPVIPWRTRIRIAVGAARGLAYLHEDCSPKIIHRDIKSSNILLDSNFEAKVADFGLAKISSEDFTHVSTRVMGTFGYLAPEYAASGKLTDKSDVYSFGVVLLELITGRKPVDTQSPAEETLVEWARPELVRALEENNPEALVDPQLGNEYSRADVMRVAVCASSAIRHSAKKRPRMAQILRVLEGDAL